MFLLYAHTSIHFLLFNVTRNVKATQNIAVVFFPYSDPRYGFYEMLLAEIYIFHFTLSPASTEGGVLCVQRAHKWQLAPPHEGQMHVHGPL